MKVGVAALAWVLAPALASADEAKLQTQLVAGSGGILLPMSFLLAVGMIFASVSCVLSADRTKARTARRLSILSALVLTLATVTILFVPIARRLVDGGAVGLLGFAATLGISTWLNMRRCWSFGKLLLRVFIPGLLLSVVGASLSWMSS